MSAAPTFRSAAPQLQMLAELPAGQLETLTAAAAGPRAAEDLPASAAAAACGLPAVDVDAVIEVAVQVLADALTYNQDIDATINAAVALSGIAPELRPRAAARLGQIAGIDAVRLLGQASAAVNSNRHSFRSCRVLTDIRVVDDPDDETSIAGVCVIHQLKIDYEDSAGLRSSFYATVDRADLTALVVAAGRGVVESIQAEKLAASSGVDAVFV